MTKMMLLAAVMTAVLSNQALAQTAPPVPASELPPDRSAATLPAATAPPPAPAAKLARGWRVRAVRAMDITEFQADRGLVAKNLKGVNLDNFGEFTSKTASPLTLDEISVNRIKMPTGLAPGLVAEAFLDVQEGGDYYVALQLDAQAQNAVETNVTVDLVANATPVVTANAMIRHNPTEALQIISDTRRLEGLKAGRYALGLAYSCSQREAGYAEKFGVTRDVPSGKPSFKPCPAVTLLVRGPGDRGLRPVKDTEIGHEE